MAFNELIERPEIFIGLVGAAGTDLRAVSDKLMAELQQVGYDTKVIRLSSELEKLEHFAKQAKHVYEDQRIDALMNAGDVFRKIANRADAVCLLAVAEIRRIRALISGNERRPANSTAFILHSLKRPEEARTLRSIYGSSFFTVSVFSPLPQRTDALCRRIAVSREALGSSEFLPQAKIIIDRDKKEVGTLLGQDVEATFPEADFFLDATAASKLDEQIVRVTDILFGHPFITPTVDEFGMFHARAASLRSADLSRQVGAVIATRNGEFLSEGCNEVPRAEGGANWDDVVNTPEDYRDFRIGYDSTAKMKNDLMVEMFERLSDWLDPSLREVSASKLAETALHDGEHPILKGTRIDSLLEFGRGVHAEMSAITEAARRGVSILNARLYCTTFPCHMCARHIIAAGISEVIYIEPYPKSMAKHLYARMITIDDGADADENAVKFRPFVGVSPRRFIEFFQAPQRKNGKGLAVKWEKRSSGPRLGQLSDYRTSQLAFSRNSTEYARDWMSTRAHRRNRIRYE